MTQPKRRTDMTNETHQTRDAHNHHTQTTETTTRLQETIKQPNLVQTANHHYQIQTSKNHRTKQPTHKSTNNKHATKDGNRQTEQTVRKPLRTTKDI